MPCHTADTLQAPQVAGGPSCPSGERRSTLELVIAPHLTCDRLVSRKSMSQKLGSSSSRLSRLLPFSPSSTAPLNTSCWLLEYDTTAGPAAINSRAQTMCKLRFEVTRLLHSTAVHMQPGTHADQPEAASVLLHAECAAMCCPVPDKQRSGPANYVCCVHSGEVPQAAAVWMHAPVAH